MGYLGLEMFLTDVNNNLFVTTELLIELTSLFTFFDQVRLRWYRSIFVMIELIEFIFLNF
jgi:hypothetical protein